MNEAIPGASRPPIPEEPAVAVDPGYIEEPAQAEPVGIPVHPAMMRFSIGEMIPLKGVWFRVADIAGVGMALIVTGPTAKSRKK